MVYAQCVRVVSLFVVNKEESQLWNKSYNEHCGHQDEHVGQCRPVKLRDGFVKTVAGNKQVHAHWRRKIADLHIGQKNNA